MNTPACQCSHIRHQVSTLFLTTWCPSAVQTGGQCHCKKNVGRRSCDTCLPGFHGLDPAEPDGCRVCICDSRGTQQGSNICDVTSGQCPCKENVGGEQCERCKAGFYSLDPARPEGCLHCGCDPDGVQDGEVSCNQTSGQCRCRPGVTGKDLLIFVFFKWFLLWGVCVNCIVAIRIFREWHRLQNCSNDGTTTFHYWSSEV